MDPAGIDTEFRGMLEVYGPSDTLLLSDYDDYTGPYPYYRHGGRQVAFVDYELPEAGDFVQFKKMPLLR